MIIITLQVVGHVWVTMRSRYVGSWPGVRVVELTHVHRQAGDIAFQQILAEARWGRVSRKSLAVLNVRHNVPVPAGCGVVLLTCTNAGVDAENTGQLGRLPGETKRYADAAGHPLELKLNAPVVLLRNIDARLRNGSRGTIAHLGDTSVQVIFSDGSPRA